MLEFSVNPYYLIPRVSGTLLLVLSLALPVYLSRIEPFLPLFFASTCLITLTEWWRLLRIKRNQTFLRAENFVVWSIRILAFGFVVNVLIAVVTTFLRTGFSLYYATSMSVGMFVYLIGVLVGTWSLILRKNKPLP